jgi:hypothetical protein
MVVQPLPDPTEDDGRKVSNLILKEVAEAITSQYAPDEVADFLAEEGIPPRELKLPDDTAPDDVHAILAALWRWGSEGRRMLRQFIGRWLDDRLLSGPDAEQRARLIEQLARQGRSGAAGRARPGEAGRVRYRTSVWLLQMRRRVAAHPGLSAGSDKARGPAPGAGTRRRPGVRAPRRHRTGHAGHATSHLLAHRARAV